MSTCVCTYVQYVSVYICMCMRMLCVCSKEILYCFKYIIIHQSLYTIAVYYYYDIIILTYSYYYIHEYNYSHWLTTTYGNGGGLLEKLNSICVVVKLRGESCVVLGGSGVPD